MTFSRNVFIAGIAVVLMVVLGVFAVWYFNSDAYAYRGLVLTDDYAQMTDSERAYYEQQLDIAQSALVAQKATMDIQDVDWDLFTSIAWNASMLGDLVLARETIEEYLTLNAINMSAWNFYGEILTRMEDYSKAEAAFAKAVELDPTEEFYRDLVMAIRNNPPDGSREDEVKIVLEDGVDRVGQTPWFMTELATWYLTHDDCDRALDHYEVAKDLLPPDNEAIKQDIASAKTQCENS